MNVEQLSKFIAEIGFPIFVAVLLMFRIEGAMSRQTTALMDLTTLLKEHMHLTEQFLRDLAITKIGDKNG